MRAWERRHFIMLGLRNHVPLNPLRMLLVVGILAMTSFLIAEEPTFFRGLNLNGPSVFIDGNRWEGSDSSFYECEDKAFEQPNVPLIPPTDSERSKMIRSSRWGGNRVELTEIPSGSYTLFLYVWEDNNSETYSVSVNGQLVKSQHQSGSAGHWDKLGPWPVSLHKAGSIIITSQGGAANFSGVELWRGDYDGLGKPISEDELAFFEKRIRPLLINKCYECHSAQSTEVQGDLLVDSRATLHRGGARGPAVIPGDLERSSLITAVRYLDDELQMPPDGKLNDAEIADLETWVKSGAPDPRSEMTRHLGKKIDLATAREFWSLRPIAVTSPATVDSDWPRNDIDRFILARLIDEGLAPSSDADKRSLLRRATYDLIGLPPTIEETEAFLEDNSSDAFARVVDRLLDSPLYGQRWGRHWLDVVRYADTAGDNSDYPIPQIHLYRDWVIEAFNRDLPYDEFVRDQLAGDLRGGETETQRRERIIATGYLANARRFGSRVDDYPQHLTIEDTIDNLGRSFLGMTLACARCHDHKFDPITHRDYYALYGIFSSTRYPWPGIELDKKQRDFVILATGKERAKQDAEMKQWETEHEPLDNRVKELQDAVKNAKSDEKATKEEELENAKRLAKEHRAKRPHVDTAYAVSEGKNRGNVALQLKGDPNRPGDLVPRRFLTVLGGQELPPESESSGRLELAEWILSPNNPLPARVMVNRIWQNHFGRGIAPTSNDFGKQGKPPTHIELLDYLADQFRQSGWSIKAMHRLIMASRTYQQSTARDPQAITQDPTNQWLAGFPRLRINAEAIRDSLLMHGGSLEVEAAGPHPFPAQHTWDFTQHKPFKAVYETNHRSVYLMTQRIQRHPFLAIFDGADPSTSTALRMSTTTPLQALFLLNDPLVHQQSQRIADRITNFSPTNEARIEYAYQMLFARAATADELEAAESFMRQAQSILRDNGVAKDELTIEAWRAYVRSLLRLNEFVYLD